MFEEKWYTSQGQPMPIPEKIDAAGLYELLAELERMRKRLYEMEHLCGGCNLNFAPAQTQMIMLMDRMVDRAKG